MAGIAIPALVKTLFPSGRVKKQLYPRHPGVAMVPKDENIGGDYIKIPVIYGATNGGSATFAKAQSNRSDSASKAFLVNTIEDYATVEIPRKIMLQTRTDKMARVEAVDHAHEMSLYVAGRSLSHSFYRDGEGILGQISSTSTVSTATITLTDISDAVHFEVGMKLVASTAAGGALRNSGDTVTLTAVNRRTGQLTVATSWDTHIAAIAATDYLYREGDARNNGSTKLKMSGLAAWLPTTAPSPSESFFSVDRSSDSRLYGNYVDASTLPPEEALIEAQSVINRESLGLDLFHCNNAFFRLLQKAVGSRTYFERGSRKSSDADINFETFRIHGDKGVIDIVADPDCPFLDRAATTKALGYFLRSKSWTLYSMLEAPHIFDEGSAQQDLRISDSDGYEGRVGYYANLAPTKDDSGPGDSGVAHLPIS